MSQTLQDLAWLVRLKPTPKLLLLTLCRLADEERRECAPRIEYLMDEVNVTRVSIFSAIESLIAAKAIAVTRRPGKSSLYALTFEGRQ